jgi:phenylacetate-coenzyme A ligase PaaK-like adenylate-forming protein
MLQINPMYPHQIADIIRLEQAQGKSPEAIQGVRGKKLRALIHQAHRHVPYYRNLMDRLTFKPEDIRKAEDLWLQSKIAGQA